MSQPKTLKILIVEDVVDLQNAFRRYFQGKARSLLGCPILVLPATTIAQAEERVQAHPDLDGILLDASLGDKQEIDENRRIRPDLAVIAFLKNMRMRYPALPIIATSGDPNCNVRLVHEGCTSGVSKADGPAELINRLVPAKPAGT